MKLIGLIDSDDHTAPRHDGKQMLTVPCFTICHDLARSCRPHLENDLPLISKRLSIEGSLPMKKTCLLDTEGLNGGQTYLCLVKEKKNQTCKLSKSAVLTLKNSMYP